MESPRTSIRRLFGNRARSYSRSRSPSELIDTLTEKFGCANDPRSPGAPGYLRSWCNSRGRGALGRSGCYVTCRLWPAQTVVPVLPPDAVQRVVPGGWQPRMRGPPGRPLPASLPVSTRSVAEWWSLRRRYRSLRVACGRLWCRPIPKWTLIGKSVT